MSNPNKYRLPSHLVQSPSPARGGIEKPPPTSWWAKLVGRRPSKPIDVDVSEYQSNLTTNYFNDITQKEGDDAIMRNYKGEILDPKTGEVEHSTAYYNALHDVHRQNERDKIHAAQLAAQIEFEVQNPEEMRRRKLNYASRDARWKAENLERLNVAHKNSSWGHLSMPNWIKMRNRKRLPDMTVPGDKPNTVEENFRLYGPLELGRLHDPRDANRMYYPPHANGMGGKSKRILKSKSRSNKGKKTHRSTRSRSTCRRSTCRRSTCRR